MADVDYLALYQADQAQRAGANINGAQGIAPASAVKAFKDAPVTGVPAELGMHDDGGMATLAAQRREQAIRDSSPSVNAFAAKSPAHVAATREDWGTLAKLASKVDEWNTVATADFFAPGEQAVRSLVENAQRYYVAASRPQMPRNLVEGLVPGLSPQDRAAGSLLGSAAAVAFSPFSGLANVVARPLSYIPRYASPTLEGGAPRRLTQPEAQAAVASDLLTAFAGLGPKGGGGNLRRALPALTAPGEPPISPRAPSRPGVAPEDTPLYKAVAETDVEGATQIQDTLAEAKFHSELPALSTEFLDTTPMNGRVVYVDPQAILKAYSEGHEVLPQFATEIGEALNSGRDVAIPESAFHADLAGKPYAEALNRATRFREGGVSVDEAEGLSEARLQVAVEGETPTVPALESQRAPVPEDVAESVPRTLAADTEASVEEVFQEFALKSLFAEPKAAGLTKPQFERYDAQLAEAKAAATERVLRRTYDQIRHERTPEWQDTLARFAATVQEEVEQEPAHIARQELQYNEGPRGEPLERPGVKFSRREVVDAYGAATADALPRSMFAKDGQHPDEIAPLFGYETGAELVSDLLDLEAARINGGHASSREHLKFAVRQEAERRARAELGYDISREGLMAAAREAAVLPQVEDFLEENLREIAETLGLPFQKGQLEQIALAQFDALPVSEAVNVYAFERGMLKTGNKTQIALEKGDWPAAFVGRQQQLINFHQLKAAHFLAKKVAQTEKKFRYLARKNTIKGLSQPFLDQLHTYLPQFDFPTKREPQELAEALRGVSLPQFVATVQETNGAFRDVPAVEAAPLHTLTVDDFWKVRHFVFGMDKYGRELQKEIKEGRRGDFAAQRARALASVPPGKPPKKPPPDPEMGASRSDSQTFVDVLKWYDAYHRKPADMVEWLDRGNPLGPWHEAVIAPPYRGANDEGQMHREVYEPVVAAWRKIPLSTKRAYKTKLVSPFTVGGRPIQAFRENVVPLALYTGAPDRLAKAAEGYGVTPAVLLDWINQHITPEEVDLVETIWDRFAVLAPSVSEVLRRMKGVGLERVETAPVTLAGRTLAGGYVPLEYDRRPEINPQVAAWEKAKLAQLQPDGLEALFNEVLPNRGFAEEVTNFVGPVDVSLSRLSRLFNNHIKYAAYAGPVSDVRKFLYDPLVAGTVVEKFGEPYLDAVQGWLDGIVRPAAVSDALLNGADRLLEGLGRNITVGTLALSYGTLVSQVAGVTNAIAALSEGNVLRGTARFAGGTKEFTEALAAALAGGRTNVITRMFPDSQMMQQRYGTLEQNMTEALLEADEFAVRGYGKAAAKWVERHAFHAIGIMELLASGPLWFGARAAAVAEGRTLEQANRIADRAVIKAQGSGRRVDQSAAQRARGMLKLMYAFQSYFNQQYQLYVDIYRGVKTQFGGMGGEPPNLPPPPDIIDAEQGPDGVWRMTDARKRYNASQAFIWALAIVGGGLLANYLTGRKIKPLDPLADLFRPLVGVNTLVRNAATIYKFVPGGKVVVSNPQTFGGDLLDTVFELILTNLANLAKVGARNKDGSPKKKQRPLQNLISLGAIRGVPGIIPLARSAEYVAQLTSGEQRPREGREWVDVYLGLTGGPREEQKSKGGKR